MIRVTVWNENVHERHKENVRAIYPEGIHGTIAGFLNARQDISARTATLDMAEHGLTAEVLAQTDVLTWWGHTAHQQVEDAVVARVYRRVMEGMGLIVLHSGHASKIFARLMGTDTHQLRWYQEGTHCRLWTMDPGHPIAAGMGDFFVVPQDETYGEHFVIPVPDELVFMSWFPGGEIFRSGCCWKRGLGKVFYFQPGHETFPVYHQKEIQQVITNAVRWAVPAATYVPAADRQPPCEKLPLQKG